MLLLRVLPDCGNHLLTQPICGFVSPNLRPNSLSLSLNFWLDLPASCRSRIISPTATPRTAEEEEEEEKKNLLMFVS
jgi:hypothetical protein